MSKLSRHIQSQTWVCVSAVLIVVFSLSRFQQIHTVSFRNSSHYLFTFCLAGW